MKVERFTYPVITPSAARGIFDAIYCKPIEFRWQITAVEVLRPISWVALRRNEVSQGAPSTQTITAWREGRQQPQPIQADADSVRQQRQTIALCNVAYRLRARIVPWPQFERTMAKLENEFQRRVLRGKCFYQPSFGCREFPAYFKLDDGTARPEPIDMDIGLMLYDVFDLSRPGSNDDEPNISVFRAELRAGRMDIPDWDSPAVYRLRKEVGDAAPDR
jgi:CRISPR-associated protein Cas5d